MAFLNCLLIHFPKMAFLDCLLIHFPSINFKCKKDCETGHYDFNVKITIIFATHLNDQEVCGLIKLTYSR